MLVLIRHPVFTLYKVFKSIQIISLDPTNELFCRCNWICDVGRFILTTSSLLLSYFLNWLLLYTAPTVTGVNNTELRFLGSLILGHPLPFTCYLDLLESFSLKLTFAVGINLKAQSNLVSQNPHLQVGDNADMMRTTPATTLDTVLKLRPDLVFSLSTNAFWKHCSHDQNRFVLPLDPIGSRECLIPCQHHFEQQKLILSKPACRWQVFTASTTVGILSRSSRCVLMFPCQQTPENPSTPVFHLGHVYLCLSVLLSASASWNTPTSVCPDYRSTGAYQEHTPLLLETEPHA